MPDDELNQDHGPTGEEPEDSKARIAELEGLVAERDEALRVGEARLSEAGARITELEQMTAERESEVAALKHSLASSGETLDSIKTSLAQAVSSYRALVVQANPDVLDELVAGDSVETVNQSLETAQALISRVRQGLEVEASRMRVPAGAPQRTLPDLSALSPREKIQYAVGSNK